MYGLCGIGGGNDTSIQTNTSTDTEKVFELVLSI